MSEFYSEEYMLQLRALHKEKKAFGNKATELVRVSKIIDEYRITSVLDYGCGKGVLVQKLKETYPDFNIHGYDPGQVEFATQPEKSEMITSSDVLEHIEPLHLDSVFKHMFELSEKITYLEISCFPAKKHLSDGRNAHLIIEQPLWWETKILEYWTPEQVIFSETVSKGIKKINDVDIELIYLRTLLKK